MTRRLVSASMALALVLSTSAAFAAPFHFGAHNNIDAKLGGKAKQVSLSLRNDSKSPMTVTIGDKQMTLKAGETQSAKLPAGEKILAADGCSSPTGTVLAVVTPELSDATVVLR